MGRWEGGKITIKKLKFNNNFLKGGKEYPNNIKYFEYSVSWKNDAIDNGDFFFIEWVTQYAQCSRRIELSCT